MATHEQPARAGTRPTRPIERTTTMAEKQSILGRIAQLTRANINALLDRAEDPEKMLDQLIRDYTNNIAEAEQAIAQTIGNRSEEHTSELQSRGHLVCRL